VSGAGRLPAAGLAWFNGRRWSRWRGPLRGSDFTWSIAFIVPYAAGLVAFAVVPIGYALWSAGKASLYADLIDDPRYLPTVVSTLLFVGLSVNLKMFLALLLSGFFMRRR
jgi:multiple sugar transport system permease protein